MKYHFYKIEIAGKYIYRVLNSASKIKLRNIKKNNEKDVVAFSIDHKDYNELKKMLEEKNITILSCIEYGLHPKVFNFPSIKMITGIIVIFLLLLFLNSLFIWNIEIEGNYSYSDNQIIKFVHSKSITEGTLKSSVKCNELEKEIRQQYNDISWVCAEIKGTSLIVHIKENYITEISSMETKPYNLTAPMDGKIISILTRRGTAKVKVGDIVKKGDVLISGIVEVFDESETKLFNDYCNADGDIICETIYKYNDKLNINYTKKMIHGTKTIYLPSILSYKWVIHNDKKREIKCDERKIKLFGNYYLPISIQKYTIDNVEMEKRIYSRKEAETILMSRLNNKLTLLEQKGYKIIKKNVKIGKDNNFYKIQGTITCHEPFGQVTYIDKKEYEEGTTNIERN